MLSSGRRICRKVGGKLTAHLMFNTAKIELANCTIDIAMARTETYAKPGALPVVTSGHLKTDLFRAILPSMPWLYASVPIIMEN